MRREGSSTRVGVAGAQEINNKIKIKVRKVILSIQVTLDGFIEGPNGELDWMIMDEEKWKDVNDLLSTVDTTLFGRVAYQGFANYWPAAATNSSSPKNEIDFAHWIENIPKIVFSKTLEKVEWKNSTLIKENIAEEIVKMKQQAGKDLLMFGGAGIASTFMKLGLIDEYRINVHPIILGRGISLFNPDSYRDKDRINLRLLKTNTFCNGVVLLNYSPAKKEL